MKSKLYKKVMCIFMASSVILCATGCGGSDNKQEEEEVQYDEEGNPIEEEEHSTILASDADVMITGLIAATEDGSISKKGVWLSEQEVGQIADRYREGLYTYEKGKLKKSEVEYIANFYDIDGERVSSMYIDKNMNICYEGQYIIKDSIMKGLFADAVDKIQEDSVLQMDQIESNNTAGNNTTQNNDSDSANTTVSLSKQAFLGIDGVDDATAEVLAQSTFNLGIPVVKSARLEANLVLFTDINDNEYTLSIVDGRITSVHNETTNTSIYSLDR